ncbi:hypothetical protein KFL_001230070 [Klebsormidium nitens]|uniref:F-box domain-containing protein n=1 Tax=Klebsormidium nitens TaxID=105231 RepID=A0A1Y1I004_KLENI|nr:hypothetical protein KFL_001230070 [Klebsormidium nitens]|eukprot:GAQ82759.1 hypothetical protein KFL_001230070 [Klebsormidium nitens]
MASGGLARGFLLKGGRQGVFTAGSSKLSQAAPRTSDVTDENEKASEAESLPIQGGQPFRSGVNAPGAGAKMQAAGGFHTPGVQPGVNTPGAGRVTTPQGGGDYRFGTGGERRLQGSGLVEESGVKAVDGDLKVTSSVLKAGTSAQSGRANPPAKADSPGTKSEVAFQGLANARAQGLPDPKLGVKLKSEDPAKAAGLKQAVGNEGTASRRPSVREATRWRSEKATLRRETPVRSTSLREEGLSEKSPHVDTTTGTETVAGETKAGVGASAAGGAKPHTAEVPTNGGNSHQVVWSTAQPGAGVLGGSTVCEIEEVVESSETQSGAETGLRQQTSPRQKTQTGLGPEVSPTVAPDLLQGGTAETGGSDRLRSGVPFRAASFRRMSQQNPPPKTQPKLPPEMVSFLLGPSPAFSTGLQTTKTPQSNPFDQTLPGWSAELSLASAVARDDVATRFLNLPAAALQSVFSTLPATAIVNCQAVSKTWRARFSDDPKLWASVDLSSDDRLRNAATDDLLLELLGRSRDRWGTSYLTSVDVTGCKNVTSAGVMSVMKHRASLRRLRAHASGAQLPTYFARWLAETGVDAHVDVHTAQPTPSVGFCNVASTNATWQDLVQMLAGMTRVQICGLDLRPTPVPLPSDPAIPFLHALFAAPNLQTLRVGSAFGDRELLRDIGIILGERVKSGAKGLEVLELEGLRGKMVEGTWEAVFGLLGGDDCRIKRLSINGCNLGREGAAAMSAALSDNASVTELEVSDCGFDTQGWRWLAEALQKNSSVKKLTLGGWGWKEAKAETGPLGGPTVLLSDDDGIGYIGAAIAGSASLKELRLLAWCGPCVLDSTGRVIDFSPGFATFLIELSSLDPSVSRLKSVTVEFDEMCVEDRGRAGAARIAAMIGGVVGKKGVRVTMVLGAREDGRGLSDCMRKAFEGVRMRPSTYNGFQAQSGALFTWS